MNTSSRSEQTKIVASGLLCFALVMLIIAAYRAADPVVGERWQGFIKLVVLITGIGLLALGGWYAQKRRHERQQLRRYYQDAGRVKSEVPVTPASFALTQSPTRPS